MEQDIIDACPFSPDLAVSCKIHELAGHVTEVVLWEGPGWGVWISERAWEKISPEHQKSLLHLANQVLEKELSVTDTAGTQAREFLQEQGINLSFFSRSELEKWEQANPDFFADWIKKMDGVGKGEAARQIVTLWKEIRKKVACAGGSVSETGEQY